jgi:hypothetical protein
MNEADAERIVYDRLLGPHSLSAQVRDNTFVDEVEVNELHRAISALTEFYRDRPNVPKSVALAFVDIAARFENRFYSESQQERLQDIGLELSCLAEELFSDD